MHAVAAALLLAEGLTASQAVPIVLTLALLAGAVWLFQGKEWIPGLIALAAAMVACVIALVRLVFESPSP